MVVILFAAAAVGIQLIRKWRKKEAQAKALRRARKLTKASEIISCLIAQVHAADDGERAHASEVWKALGYDELDEQDLLTFQIAPADIRHFGQPTCKIRFMVFRRRDTDKDRVAVRPKYVVAIRGTKPRCQQDLRDDFRHSNERLHKSPAYPVLLRMTEKIVDRCQRECNSIDNNVNATVCVAGHSLGAAFGLLVARQLTLDDQHVEAHLFNPPFLTLEVLGKDLLSLIRSSVGAELCEQASDAFSRVFQALDWKLTPETNSRVRDMEKKMDEEYARLQRWTPNLYVNVHDHICNQYIEYFKNKNVPRSTSTQTKVLQLCGVDARSYHLIPSAVLHTNDRRHPVNLLVCHKNNQWYKYRTTDDSAHYNLLSQHRN